jgi:phage-related minor tail protein
MASNNIARLGVVLGLDTAVFTAEVDKAIAATSKLKREIKRDSNAAAGEITALKNATDDYGKTLTKVDQVQREISQGRFMNATKEMKDRLLEQAKAYDAKVVAEKKSLVTGALTAQQQLQLTYQTTDFITQIASGQNALIALLQQGGQLKDTMGGFGGMFRALGTIITPFNVAVAATVASVGALSYAFYKGADESSKLRDALILTGKYAGITQDQFFSMSKTLSSNLSVTVGDAKDALMALVSSGQFIQQNMDGVARSILNVSKLSGESAKDVASKLIPAFDGTASSAKKLDDRYHFLTLSQYQQLEALEKVGKKYEAIQLVTDSLNKSLEGQTRELGYLESAWEKVRVMASKTWDTILGIGRKDSPEETLKRLRLELDALLQTAETRSKGGFNTQLFDSEIKRKQAEIDALQKQIDDNSALAKKAQEEQRKKDQWEKAGGLQKSLQLEDEYKKAHLEKLYYMDIQAATETGKVISEVNRQYSLDLLEMDKANREENYVFAIQRQKIFDEQRVKLELEAQKKINEIQGRRLLDNQEALRVFREEAAAAAESMEAPAKALRKQYEATEDLLKLQQDKQNLELSMLGKSQIEVQAAMMRLDLEKQIADMKKRDDIGDKDVFERRLREQFALQEKMLELSEYANRMKDIYNSVFQNMENGLRTFVQTGKLNFKDLARSIIQDIIYIQMKAQAIKLFSLGSSFLSNTFNPVGPTQTVPQLPSSFDQYRTAASGGNVEAGMPVRVGELGPEMFVPRTAGTIIPSGNLASAMSGQVVNYNGPFIQNMSAIDTQSGIQFLSRNKQAVWAANQSAQRSLPVSK